MDKYKFGPWNELCRWVRVAAARFKEFCTTEAKISRTVARFRRNLRKVGRSEINLFWSQRRLSSYPFLRHSVLRSCAAAIQRISGYVVAATAALPLAAEQEAGYTTLSFLLSLVLSPANCLCKKPGLLSRPERYFACRPHKQLLFLRCLWWSTTRILTFVTWSAGSYCSRRGFFFLAHFICRTLYIGSPVICIWMS